MSAVIKRYAQGRLACVTPHEELQYEPLPSGVMTLEEMNVFRTRLTDRLIPVQDRKRSLSLTPEVRAIDRMLDDAVLNALLAPPGYTPSKREKTPAMLFRAELLKSLYYAELSYRKFCAQEVNDLERKRNRFFIGLDLRRGEKIHHSELSAFRLTVSWKQQLNLLVYVLSQFFTSQPGQGSFYYALDSTDLAAALVSHPLATVTVKISGQEEKIALYSQLDTDCGERRNKSDRSRFFVGYKVHTLSVLNPLTGKAYALLPVVTGANHHDGNYLKPIVTLGQALGLDIRFMVADEAYDGAALTDLRDVTLITPPRSAVGLPPDVVVEQGVTQVFCHQACETPMLWVGREEAGHEFHCDARPGTCPFELNCPRAREIPVDNGLFGHIPRTEDWLSTVDDTRKYCERPFNLLKHRNGIDRITVKSRQAVQVVQTTATIAVLLLEIVRFKKKPREDKKQIELPLMAS